MDGIAVTVAERGKLDNAARIDGQIFFKGSHWQCILFSGQPASNLLHVVLLKLKDIGIFPAGLAHEAAGCSTSFRSCLASSLCNPFT